ncbi:MAG TPA: hypothetical protein VE596_05635 [Gaiellaceae bacterium]|nr:hypothetical protein [Gaiellaceae bacterium]
MSPNGDGFRDAAIVRFVLDEPASVRLDVLRTDVVRSVRPAVGVVWSSSRSLPAVPGRLVSRPARFTPPRTYVLRLTLTDGRGR